MSLTTKKIAAVWRALKTVVQLNPSSVQALVFPLKGGGGGWGGGEGGGEIGSYGRSLVCPSLILLLLTILEETGKNGSRS